MDDYAGYYIPEIGSFTGWPTGNGEGDGESGIHGYKGGGLGSGYWGFRGDGFGFYTGGAADGTGSSVWRDEFSYLRWR
jgi:hypothetical protein